MKSFYISLPSDDEDQSIGALLRHALSQLDEEVKDKSFELGHFDFVSAYVKDGTPSMFVGYGILTSREATERDERRQYAAEVRVSPQIHTEELHEWPEDGVTYGMIEYRLPQGDEQDNARKLVTSFATRTKALDVAQVLDCIYHDFCDSDGVGHPFFRMYYKKA